MKKNHEASQSQDELITALFYLYQEALKKDAKLAHAIQVAIETSEKLGPAQPKSKDCQDLLKQFYVMREFQKLDPLQKQRFIQEIDGFQEKGKKRTKSSAGRKTSKHAG